MAYAFRTPNGTASGGNISGGSLAITKPSGVVNGDLMIVAGYLENDTNTWTTVPTGWNTDTTNLKIANTGSFSLQVFWKIAASEGASWTWAPATSNFRTMAFACYSGATGSGATRMDVKSSNQADATILTAQTAPSVTTTVNNDLVTYVYGNFSGTNPTTMTGFCTNLRIAFGSVTIADANQATAGATGTSRPSAGPGSETFACMHIAWFLDAAGGVSFKASPAVMVKQQALHRASTF